MLKKEFDILVYLSTQLSVNTQEHVLKELGMPAEVFTKLLHELELKGLVADGRITELGIAALEPYKVKRAIFLAAGFGSRLAPITFNTPKPLVRVNGQRMIDTLLDAVMAAEIPEIIIVRGYLGEQFDQLLYKYPNIRFIENPMFNASNNISSAMCARYLFKNAYVLESDLILYNPKLIRKYEYKSNFLGIPVAATDDWCFRANEDGVITSQGVGGEDCYQMVGISYWDEVDGVKLVQDLDDVFNSPGGKDQFWEQTVFLHKREKYQLLIRPCSGSDILEIDSYNDLKGIDKLYALQKGF